MKEKDELDDKMEQIERKQASPVKTFPTARPQQATPAAPAAPKFIAEHTVGGGETLSHLSLKYYGSATKPYWMVIYETNKALIGENPNRLKRGIALKIPELPAELKK